MSKYGLYIVGAEISLRINRVLRYFQCVEASHTYNDKKMIIRNFKNKDDVKGAAEFKAKQ